MGQNLVGTERLELSHLSIPDSKSGASANSATLPSRQTQLSVYSYKKPRYVVTIARISKRY